MERSLIRNGVGKCKKGKKAIAVLFVVVVKITQGIRKSNTMGGSYEIVGPRGNRPMEQPEYAEVNLGASGLSDCYRATPTNQYNMVVLIPFIASVE